MLSAPCKKEGFTTTTSTLTQLALDYICMKNPTYIIFCFNKNCTLANVTLFNICRVWHGKILTQTFIHDIKAQATIKFKKNGRC